MRILNEREKARQIIESKEMLDDKKETALLIVKYYNEIGEDVTKIKNNILAHFKHNDKDFNEVLNSTWVERFVKNNSDAKFNDMEFIPVSKSELESIASVKNLNMEKLLFVMLVCAKYDKKEKYNDYWYNEKVVNTGQQMYSDLFRMAKIKQKKEAQYNILNNILKNTNMLSMSNRPDRVGFKLNYVDNNDCEIKINSFDYDFINEYLLWKGLDLCEVCGDVIEKNNNKNKYCKLCAYKIQLKLSRDYKAKIKEN